MIVPTHLALDFSERRRRAEVIGHGVVKPQHGRLQLRHDDVFIVARIADQGAGASAFGRSVARQVAGIRVEGFSPRERTTEL